MNTNLRRGLLAALLLTPAALAQTAHVEAKLVSIDPDTTARAGAAVDIEGDWAVMGIPTDFIGPLRYGAVEIFKRQNGGVPWIFSQKIQPSFLQEYDTFGTAVAMQGTTLVIGAMGDDDLGEETGAAYVYERVDGQYQLVQTLYASDANIEDYFGGGAAIDGDTLVIGAIFAGPGYWHPGSAYVFVRDSSGVWVEQAKLELPNGYEQDLFGRRLDIEGDRIVVGVVNEDTQFGDDGAAYVYDRTGTTWSLTEKLVAPDNPGTEERFGWTVSIDGDRVAVGCPGDDEQIGDGGSVYVFTEGPGGFVLEQKLFPAQAVQNHGFGRGMTMIGDLIAVGASSDYSWEPNALYLFRHDGTSWVQMQKTTPDNVFGVAEFGEPIATDGARLIVGAQGDFIGQFGDAGSAFVYAVPPATVSYCEGKTTSIGCVATVSWSGEPSASATAPFTITASEVPSLQPGVFFYSTGGRAAQPFQGGTICAKAPVIRTGVASAGGNFPPLSDCSGSFSIDFNAWIAGHPSLTAGMQVNGQFWFRDPGDAFGSALSDAIEFQILP